MILNDTVSTKQYNTINVMIVNFPFLDGDFPRRPYYGDYISQFALPEHLRIMLVTSIVVTNS